MNFIYFLLSSGCLILLMLGVRKVFRKQLSAGVIYALWLIPMFRLLLPFSLLEIPQRGSVTEIMTMPYEYVEDIISVETAMISKTSDEKSAVESLLNEEAGMTGQPVAEEKNSKSVSQENRESALQENKDNVSKVLGMLWLAGSMLCGSYAVFVNLKLQRAVRHMHTEYEDGPLPVVVSDAPTIPCLFGVFHPRILVGRMVREQEELYRNALLHEVAHWSQKDHIWSCIRILLCIIYWWNPLVWIGAAAAKEDAEFACDSRVIRKMNVGERKAYGLALVQLLEYAQEKPVLLNGAISVVSKNTGLKSRILGIVNDSRTKKTLILPLLSLLLMVLTVGCSMPIAESYLANSWNYSESDANGEFQFSCGYDYSLQPEIVSRLCYYEIYRYGELAERHILEYRNVENERSGEAEFQCSGIVGKKEQSEKKLKLELDWGGTASTIYIPLEEEDANQKIHYNQRSSSVLTTEERQYVVQAGDDLICFSQFFGPLSDRTLSQVSCRYLTECTEEERQQALSDNHTSVLFHVVFSDLKAEELAAQYRAMSHTARSLQTDKITSNAKEDITKNIVDVAVEGTERNAAQTEETYEPADLTFVTPKWAETYQDLSGWDEKRLESSAQQALQELYELTGYQVEEAYYTTTGSGDFSFAKTEEDMEHSRVFYDRCYKDESYEKSIPTMNLASARKVWYSDVQQLVVPPNAENRNDEELAVWFLERSGLYQGETIVETKAPYEWDRSIIQVIMEDGTFYEVYVERDILGVSAIAGPYPEGFEH